jgi:HAD superfamily hydrolase (TIGR01509 family)
MRFAELDCITVDAFGTIVSLEDPVPELDRRLRAHGIERPAEKIELALLEEISYYRRHSLTGRDEDSLARLRLDCCGVFLDALSVGLEADVFVSDFIASLRFRAEQKAAGALHQLRQRSLKLAVVSNWDCSLEQRLEEVGLGGLFDLVAASALVGAEKPDPRIFQYVLGRLSVVPGRSLHIGDNEDDRAGAIAAGMYFAWAPLETALREIN